MLPHYFNNFIKTYEQLIKAGKTNHKRGKGRKVEKDEKGAKALK